MPRFAAVPLVLCLLFVIAPAAPVPKERSKGLAYFPTRVGTKWVYDENGSETALMVTKLERESGGTLVTVEWPMAGGRLAPYQTILLSRDGLFLVSETGEAYTPPWLLLKLPHRIDNEWEVNSVRGGGRIRVCDKRAARAVERVRVPAGTYEAVRVEYVWSLNGGQQSKVTEWYAPGVGMVKKEYEGTIRVLKSFTLGKE